MKKNISQAFSAAFFVTKAANLLLLVGRKNYWKIEKKIEKFDEKFLNIEKTKKT
jgi:hypothetical protein